jgi:hypothetical protein
MCPAGPDRGLSYLFQGRQGTTGLLSCTKTDANEKPRPHQAIGVGRVVPWGTSFEYRQKFGKESMKKALASCTIAIVPYRRLAKAHFEEYLRRGELQMK